MKQWINKRTAKLAAAALALTTGAALAAGTLPTVTLGAATAAPGATIEVPVNFVAGRRAVSSLQFTAMLPNGWKITSATAGPAAEKGGKSVKANVQNGTVIVFGLNRKPVASGQVAALSVSVPAGTAAGSYPITLTSVVCSDSKGRNVPSGSTSKGTVTVS